MSCSFILEFSFKSSVDSDRTVLLYCIIFDRNIRESQFLLEIRYIFFSFLLIGIVLLFDNIDLPHFRSRRISP